MPPRRRYRVVVAAGAGLATARLLFACGFDGLGTGPILDEAALGDQTSERDAIDAPSGDSLDAASENVIADVVAEEAVAPRPVGIVCGAANCSATDTCFECAAARTCTNSPGGCSGGGWFRCDDPTDCTASGAGAACCVDTVSGASVNARCEADAAECIAGGVLCDPGAPTSCQGGKLCVAAAGRLAGRFTCQ